MRKRLNYFKWFSLISGVLLILTGGIALFNPLNNLVSIGFILAFAWLMEGIANLFGYFVIDNPLKTGWDLVVALVNVLFAILLLSGGYTTFALLLPTLIAYWILIISTFQLITAIRLNVGSLWKNQFFWLAIFGVVLGIILLNHPLLTGIIASTVISLTFIQQGCHAIVRFIRLNKIV